MLASSLLITQNIWELSCSHVHLSCRQGGNPQPSRVNFSIISFIGPQSQFLGIQMQMTVCCVNLMNHRELGLNLVSQRFLEFKNCSDHSEPNFVDNTTVSTDTIGALEEDEGNGYCTST